MISVPSYAEGVYHRTIVRYHIEDISPVPRGTDIIVKTLFCLGRQKRFLSWRRRRDLKVRRTPSCGSRKNLRGSPTHFLDFFDRCAKNTRLHLPPAAPGVFAQSRYPALFAGCRSQNRPTWTIKKAGAIALAFFMVQVGRLELPASCSQSRRATNCATPG